jgi:hypothetical protein
MGTEFVTPAPALPSLPAGVIPGSQIENLSIDQFYDTMQTADDAQLTAATRRLRSGYYRDPLRLGAALTELHHRLARQRSGTYLATLKELRIPAKSAERLIQRFSTYITLPHALRDAAESADVDLLKPAVQQKLAELEFDLRGNPGPSPERIAEWIEVLQRTTELELEGLAPPVGGNVTGAQPEKAKRHKNIVDTTEVSPAALHDQSADSAPPVAPTGSDGSAAFEDAQQIVLVFKKSEVERFKAAAVYLVGKNGSQNQHQAVYMAVMEAATARGFEYPTTMLGEASYGTEESHPGAEAPAEGSEAA